MAEDPLDDQARVTGGASDDDGVGRGRDARPAVTRIDLDEDAERPAGRGDGRGEAVGAGGRVDTDPESRRGLVERTETGRLLADRRNRDTR